MQLATRPEILVVTKSELPETESVRDQLAAETNGPVLCISAVTGQGLDRLLAAIIQELDRRNLVPAATQA